MEFNFKTLAVLCAAAALGLTTGCDLDTVNSSVNSGSSVLNQNVAQSNNDNTVIEYNAPSSSDCAIVFSSDSVSVDGSGAKVDGTVVNITKAGVYTISGECENGKILINVDKKDEVTLLLDNLKLSSKNGSVIDCESGKTLLIYLADGTENSLSDSADYTFENGDDEPDAAVFSRADLIFAGTGALSVNGQYRDAIKCKDGLLIDGGTLNITAADDGITGKDYVLMQSGDVKINAGGDGVKSTNSADEGRGNVRISGGVLDIECGNDGIQAETTLCISGGEITIVAGGEDAYAEVTSSSSPFDRDMWGGRGGDRSGMFGSTSSSTDTESQKGLKAGGDITVKGGKITVTSADDSVHSNANVTVSGGALLLSSGDDGIHADELLTISEGEIKITKSYEGLEGKNIEISGGEIDINAADDGINAAGGDNGSYFGFGIGGDSSGNSYYISISGGQIVVNASGDGIDSNGTITQTGGYVTVFGPTNSGNGAIDYEKSYTMSGGTLIALGATGMAQAPSSLSQPCLSINANVSANSVIEVRDSNGGTILAVTTPKACQSLIFSCEQFKSGSDYSIYSNGTLLQTVTATDGIAGGGATGNGFGGMGGFGGGMGGRGQGGQGGIGGQDNRGDQPPQLPDGSAPELPDDFDPNNFDFGDRGNFGDFNKGQGGRGNKFGGQTI